MANYQSSIQENLEFLTFGWKPFYLFNFYRLTVAIFFAGAFFVPNFSFIFLEQYDAHLFLMTSWFYICFAVICFLIMAQNWLSFRVQILIEVLIDIFTITVLIHASGGLNSGLGILLVVTIAGGSLLTEGRTAFFFAAVASLSILTQVSYINMYNEIFKNNYTHAGMLGISFFATAFLAYTLARQARISEALANQRGIHLQYLAQLNAQIVQHIQTGIIVIDINGKISLFNEAARYLLGLNDQLDEQLPILIIPELAAQISSWQKNNNNFMSTIFRPPNGEVDVIATITELNRAGTASVLVVLEDATLTSQRAQQLKLASLGRLTASIAHEIRNPLSAINHASQLLAESSYISEQDARLTQIISNHTKRVNNIIESILQLSRREQANSQSFDLHFWLRNYINELIIQHNLNSSDIVIQICSPILMVCFDPGQLYQVIGNLCENGLRYAKNTPFLELRTEVSNESHRPCLDIRDYGQGMSEKVKSQVFEPFFTTEPRGTGLGLYLAREICEANQATLHLLDNSNVGSCFRINFSSKICE
ncbi:MAG: PAS domain-containing protein [Thiomargarita sp.]|nr:PAS domain-containing protein [Thiomargarita sp.]